MINIFKKSKQQEDAKSKLDKAIAENKKRRNEFNTVFDVIDDKVGIITKQTIKDAKK